jgi:hypothetical protein
LIFMLGKVEIGESAALFQELEGLRAALLACRRSRRRSAERGACGVGGRED